MYFTYKDLLFRLVFNENNVPSFDSVLALVCEASLAYLYRIRLTVVVISSRAETIYCDDSETKTRNVEKEKGCAEQCYYGRKCPEW